MKKIYIHIGNFKTGSTSLQNFIFLNQDLFKKNNIQVLIEKNFKTTTNNMSLFKYVNKMNKNKIIKYFSKVEKNKNLLITSEYFSTLSYEPVKINFLKKILRQLGYKAVIIYYYRTDNAYLYSFYLELLKHKKNIKIDSIFEFINKIKKYGYYFNPPNKKYFLSQNYYFNNSLIINNWKKIFKKNFFHIKFHKSKKKKIFKDFLRVLDLEKNIKLKIPPELNKTRKLYFWNLKRMFYLIYLTLIQKKLFDKNELDI